jgi:HlyD family secretion protein
MKSKLIKALIICIVAVGLGTSSYFGYQKLFAAKPAVTASSYITMKANRMNLQVNIQGTGAAYADSTKEVNAGVNGTINSLGLKIGDAVKAGDTLFTIDSEQLEQNITKAQASLDKLKLQLAQVKSEQAAYKAQLEAEAKARAEAEAKAKEGAEIESTSAANAQGNNPENAPGSNSGSSSGNNQNTGSKVNYEAEISRLNLDIAAAQKDLAAAKEALNKTTIKAPIDGLITAKAAEGGDSVQANTAVLTIMDPASTKVKVAIDELDIEKVKVGQKAEVKFEAIKGKTYEGTVENIAIMGKSSNSVTTYDVVIGIKEPSGIRFGMNANVNILVESKENALVIPVEALVESNGRKFVRVQGNNAANNIDSQANRNGEKTQDNSSGSNTTSQGQNLNNRQQRANRQVQAGTGSFTGMGRLVEIKTGLENENFIEVIEGVTEGQSLIVELPQTSTTNNNNNNRNGLGGLGNLNGGVRQQAPVSVPRNNTKNNK